MMDAVDLESDLADLRNLAFICNEMAESKLVHSRSKPKEEGYHAVMLNDDELNGLLFIISEVDVRARLLEKRFHTALDEPK